MLGDKQAIATVAVKNIEAAGKFYEGKLGLERIPTPERSVRSYKTGKSTLLVYESQFAGTNKATAATWAVGNDVDGVVKGLKAKGVAFEKYDMPDTTHEGDVHVSGKMRVAWFKDPDGNIHAIVNQ
jgi:catechol 2,3-dioxygenase-like lactoylglutathione lyase family enzyme